MCHSFFYLGVPKCQQTVSEMSDNLKVGRSIRKFQKHMFVSTKLLVHKLRRRKYHVEQRQVQIQGAINLNKKFENHRQHCFRHGENHQFLKYQFWSLVTYSDLTIVMSENCNAWIHYWMSISPDCIFQVSSIIFFPFEIRILGCMPIYNYGLIFKYSNHEYKKTKKEAYREIRAHEHPKIQSSKHPV